MPIVELEQFIIDYTKDAAGNVTAAKIIFDPTLTSPVRALRDALFQLLNKLP